MLGDDLSGVAEAAGALRRHTGRTARIELELPSTGPALSREGIVAVDLDCRRLDPAQAELRTVAGIRSAGAALVLIKIDSLLRGNVAAHLRAATGAPGPTVVATALPTAGRTVVDGVPLIGGVPMAQDTGIDAWRHEVDAPPQSILGLAGPSGGVLVDLPTVRSGTESLVRRMTTLSAPGVALLCDAETDDDLDRIATAGVRVGARFVGSAGLVGAVGRLLGGSSPGLAPDMTESEIAANAGRVVIAVGTTETVATKQLERLAADPVSQGVTVLRTPVFAGGGHDHRAAAELAARVAGEIETAVDLVVTGGETARHVLSALGVASLTVIGEAHHGAVISTTDQGFRVVTRPGSFGGVDSFVRIVQVLRGSPSRSFEKGAR